MGFFFLYLEWRFHIFLKFFYFSLRNELSIEKFTLIWHYSGLVHVFVKRFAVGLLNFAELEAVQVDI